LTLQNARSHDSSIGSVHAPVRRGGLMLILTVTKCANALKHDHIACWHCARAVTHQRRNMGGDRECGGSLEFAAERVKVSGRSQVTEQIADRRWVYDDERPTVSCKERSCDGDDCGG